MLIPVYSCIKQILLIRTKYCLSTLTNEPLLLYNQYIHMKNKKQKERQQKDKILNQIPIFLAKTYRIVDNPEYADTIEWIPQENGFIVKNITDLTEKIFPKHFKHTNYASFIRQLNLYGFHKVRSNDQGHIFTHNYFQKNNPDLLPLIKRKQVNINEPEKSQKPSEIALCNHSPSSLMIMPSAQSNNNLQLEKQLGSLTQKHESLQNLVSVLVQQNKQIILQNKSFINKINNLDDSYRKKLQTLIFLMVFGLKNGDNSIIVPQQLNNMIKAFTTGKKEKKSKNSSTHANGNQNNSSQAMQLFKKPTQDESRFNNKKIEQILQMLKMESDGQLSDLEDGKQQGQKLPGSLPSLISKRSSNNEQSFINQMPPSPIGSIRSINSRYLNGDWHDIRDDDILGKFDNSDLEIQHPGE